MYLKNKYFFYIKKFVYHIFLAKWPTCCPHFYFVFREIAKYSPKFRFRVSRNSREILRNMKLKISRKFCKITKIKIFLVSNSYRSYSRASCFALVYLKEKVEFILFFNYTKSPDATTFALSSNSILHHHPPQSPHPYNPTPSSLITHPSSPVLGTNSYCWPLESNF